jgi:hypothetical protein
MNGLAKTSGRKRVKKAAHPREVIGTRKSKCEREGKCVPDTGVSKYLYGGSAKCSICKRLMPRSKVV